MTIVATVNGNLGGDGELKNLQDGTAVLEISIAARGERPKGGGETPTQWVRATLWGKRAETLASFAQKGRFVSASGTLTMRQYQRSDGSPGVSLEMRVNEIDFGPQVGERQPAQQQSQQQGGYQSRQQQAPAQGQGYQQAPPQGNGGYQGQPQGGAPQGQRRANF